MIAAVLLSLVGGCIAYIPTQLRTMTAQSIRARVYVDFSDIVGALDQYHDAHGRYPPWTWSEDPTSAFHGLEPPVQRVPTFRLRANDGEVDFASLTTPVAYLERLWNDPFGPGRRGMPYAYIADGDGYLLISTGVDQDYDIPAAPFTPANPVAQWARMIPHLYDPTNGSLSSGDVVRFGWSGGEESSVYPNLAMETASAR